MLIVIIKTAYKPCFGEYVFRNCPDNACFSRYPVVAVTTIRCHPRKVFSNTQLLQSPLSLLRHFPLFPDDNSESCPQMCVNLCHCCFHGTKCIVVNPTSCHLIDFLNLARDCTRHSSTSHFLQFALEFLHRVLVRSALPFLCLAVPVESKTKIFQLLRSCDMGFSHVDL